MQVSGSTKIQTAEEDAVDISTSSINFKKLKKKHNQVSGFGSFIKTSTLTNTGREDAIPEQVNLEEFRHTTIKPLTDEELFKACGGRTAHKGARHGLKLSGKLARLAEQDAVLLKKFDPVSMPSTSKAAKEADEEDPELKGILYQADYSKKLSKRKKQKKSRLETELSESLDSFSLQSPTKELEEQAFHRLNDQQGGSIRKKHKTKRLKKKLSKMVNNFLEDLNIRGSKSDDESQVKADPVVEGNLKRYKSDEELNVHKKNEKREKKSKKRSQKIYIEPQPEDNDPSENETDVTELLDDSMQVELSAKKKRLSVEMKPKRKRNKDRKAEKKLAKAFSASLQVAHHDDEDVAIDEDM